MTTAQAYPNSLTWDDEVEAVLAGDLTAALGYRTPAGGVVVQAVAPIALHRRDERTVGFTTSLGFSRKLDRIAADPRVALAFHAREHGRSDSSAFVLVQGRAHVVAAPSTEERRRVRELAISHLGSPKQGWFWDRWLREYYAARVPVRVEVDRIVIWPDLDCVGTARVLGEPLPAATPDPQTAPARGAGPRVDAQRAARLLRGTAHRLLGFAGADGRPVIVPVEVESADAHGVRLVAAAPLPPGGRRAGLLGHSYRPQLIGLEARQYTGWLEVTEGSRGVYSPHTAQGYRAPPNKTLLLLLNGLLAKRGMRKARRRAR